MSLDDAQVVLGLGKGWLRMVAERNHVAARESGAGKLYSVPDLLRVARERAILPARDGV